MRKHTNTKQVLFQNLKKTPTYLLVIGMLFLAASLQAQTQMTSLDKDDIGSGDKSEREIFWMEARNDDGDYDGDKGEFIMHTASPYIKWGSSYPNEDGISFFSRTNEMLRLTGQSTFFTNVHLKKGNSGQALNNIDGLIIETGGSYNSHFVFQTASGGGGKSFSITNAGRVGVGTTALTEYFEVKPGADESAVIGMAHVGHMAGFDNYAGFSHSSQDGYGYALLQSAFGKTFLNAASGKSLNFRINNVDKMVMDASGNFGIGTDTPTANLHVNNDIHVAPNAGAWNGTAGKGLYMRYSITNNQDAAYIQSVDRTTVTYYPMGFDASSFFFNGGNVGIGVSSLSTVNQALEVHPGVDSSAIIGRVHIGHIGWNNYAGFSHIDQDAKTSYALLQHHTGETILNTASGQFLSFRNDNEDKMILYGDGKFGIGTTRDAVLNESLEVHPGVDSSAIIGRAHIGHTGWDDYAGFSHINQNTQESYALLQNSDGKTFLNAASGQSIEFRINNEDMMAMDNNGNVGIGTNPKAPENAAYKLAVDGHIKAKEVEVNVAGWPDYVFADEYTLQSLDEVEAFIAANKHLPNVPSEQEVEENGVKLGEMDAVLLRKIEELTLYVLKQHKQIEELQQSSVSPDASGRKIEELTLYIIDLKKELEEVKSSKPACRNASTGR